MFLFFFSETHLLRVGISVNFQSRYGLQELGKLRIPIILRFETSVFAVHIVAQLIYPHSFLSRQSDYRLDMLNNLVLRFPVLLQFHIDPRIILNELKARNLLQKTRQ